MDEELECLLNAVIDQKITDKKKWHEIRDKADAASKVFYDKYHEIDILRNRAHLSFSSKVPH